MEALLRTVQTEGSSGGALSSSFQLRKKPWLIIIENTFADREGQYQALGLGWGDAATVSAHLEALEANSLVPASRIDRKSVV